MRFNYLSMLVKVVSRRKGNTKTTLEQNQPNARSSVFYGWLGFLNRITNFTLFSFLHFKCKIASCKSRRRMGHKCAKMGTNITKSLKLLRNFTPYVKFLC